MHRVVAEMFEAIGITYFSESIKDKVYSNQMSLHEEVEKILAHAIPYNNHKWTSRSPEERAFAEVQQELQKMPKAAAFAFLRSDVIEPHKPTNYDTAIDKIKKHNSILAELIEKKVSELDSYAIAHSNLTEKLEKLAAVLEHGKQQGAGVGI